MIPASCYSQCLAQLKRDFLGLPVGAVVKTLHFYFRGHSFDPWPENQDPECLVGQLKRNFLLIRKKRIFCIGFSFCSVCMCVCACTLKIKNLFKSKAVLKKLVQTMMDRYCIAGWYADRLAIFPLELSQYKKCIHNHNGYPVVYLSFRANISKHLGL